MGRHHHGHQLSVRRRAPGGSGYSGRLRTTVVVTCVLGALLLMPTFAADSSSGLASSKSEEIPESDDDDSVAESRSVGEGIWGESGGGPSGTSKASPDVVGERVLGAGVTRRDVQAELVDAATEVLEQARDQHKCVLVDSGYLDLTGSVWSCTVVGEGWVEVTVVRSRNSGETSEVTTIHMDAKEWEGELETLLGERL